MVEVVQDVKAKRLGEIRQLSSQQTVTEVKISDEKIVQLDAILDQLENIYGDSLYSGNLKMTTIESSPKISLL